MTNELIKEKIDTIIKDVLVLDEQDEYKPTMSLVRDFGADSLDGIDILIRLEQEFGISIPSEDIPYDCRVENIYNYVILKL